MKYNVIEEKDSPRFFHFDPLLNQKEPKKVLYSSETYAVKNLTFTI